MAREVPGARWRLHAGDGGAKAPRDRHDPAPSHPGFQCQRECIKPAIPRQTRAGLPMVQSQRNRACVYGQLGHSGRLSVMQSNVTTLGFAHDRRSGQLFGIKQKDRLQHVLVLGATGAGKSTLLRTMALQDAARGQGFCLIDPHGDLAQSVFANLQGNAIYWDLADPASPYGYNPLSGVPKPLRPLIAAGFVDTLKHQWSDAWGPRMENLLRWSLLALLDQPAATLADIMPLLTRRAFRQEIITHIEDAECRRFWQEEFPALNYKGTTDGVAPIANKLGGFLSHPVLRKALTSPTTPMRFRRLIDDGHVLIVNLGKGRLGKEYANVMGGLILTGLRNAAFSRASVPEAGRTPYFVLVDEFENFSTDTLAEGLSELRKYGLGLVLSAQFMSQAKTATRDALLGNVGSTITFRLGLSDASYFARYHQSITERDLLNLPNHQAYVRLLVDGVQTWVFTMYTLPPNAALPMSKCGAV